MMISRIERPVQYYTTLYVICIIIEYNCGTGIVGYYVEVSTCLTPISSTQYRIVYGYIVLFFKFESDELIVALVRRF